MKKAFYAVNRNDARFFFFAAIVVLAFGLIGFLPTFVAAMFAGFDTIPMRVHIHGVFMVGWLILLATQAYLVWQDRLISHRFFGRLGVLLFFLAYASLVTLAVNNLMKTVPPFVDVGLSKVFALQIKSIVFMPILFGLAIWTAHRDTDAHRRLMVLLSAMLVEAAVVRMPWLPGVDGLNTAPLTIVAYSLIPLLPVPIYDLITRGRFHWATTFALIVAAIGKGFSVFAAETTVWLEFTNEIERLLTPIWPNI